jgi:hypothetical protein
MKPVINKLLHRLSGHFSGKPYLYVLYSLLLAIITTGFFQVLQSFPYLWGVKTVLLLITALTVSTWGFVSTRIYDSSALLWLVPLLMVVAGDLGMLFRSPSTIGPEVFLISLLYWFLTGGVKKNKDHLLNRAIIPGVLIGFVLAFNVHLYVLLLPAVLAILFNCGEKRTAKLLMLPAAAAATFALTIPISFYLVYPLKMMSLDTVSATNMLSSRTTAGLLLFVLPGIIFSFLRDWKKSSILVSFPMAYAVYPGISQAGGTARFVGIAAFFAAISLVELYRFLKEKSSGVSIFIRLPVIVRNAVLWLLPLILVILLLPVSSPPGSFRIETDSRINAETWIFENIKEGSGLVIFDELGMETKGLAENYQVFTTGRMSRQPRYFSLLSKILGNPYFVVPSFEHYGKTDPLIESNLKQLNGFREKLRTRVDFPGNNVLINYYRPLPSGNPGILIGQMKSKFRKSLEVEEIKVWTPGTGNRLENIAPGLLEKSKRGEFVLEISRPETSDLQGTNILSLRNVASDQKGKRLLILAFDCNRKGFPMKIPHGKYVHFVVNASVSRCSTGRNNHIYISQFEDPKQRNTITCQFTAPGWRTYVLSAKVQENSKRLLFGIRFNPTFSGESLRIRDIKIFISGNL